MSSYSGSIKKSGFCVCASKISSCGSKLFNSSSVRMPILFSIFTCARVACTSYFAICTSISRSLPTVKSMILVSISAPLSQSFIFRVFSFPRNRESNYSAKAEILKYTFQQIYINFDSFFDFIYIDKFVSTVRARTVSGTQFKRRTTQHRLITKCWRTVSASS